MLGTAPSRGADELVIDLEDAVAPAAKDEARAQAVHALQRPAWSAVRSSVRINAPGTPWCHQDLLALSAAGPGLHSVVVPKVNGAGDLHFVETLLAGAEAAAGREVPIRLQALIETAAGLSRIAEVAAASSRLDSLIVGYADLAASLGRATTTDLDLWRPIQDMVLVAARAHALAAIDGPHLGTAADAAFTAAAVRAKEAGFDGKWAIHPDQVPLLNDTFVPTAEDVRRAAAVAEALDAGVQDGRGVVSVDGAMIDEAVRRQALQTLARARAYRAR